MTRPHNGFVIFFPLSHPRGVYFLNKQHEFTSTIARRREIASFTQISSQPLRRTMWWWSDDWKKNKFSSEWSEMRNKKQFAIVDSRVSGRGWGLKSFRVSSGWWKYATDEKDEILAGNGNIVIISV